MARPQKPQSGCGGCHWHQERDRMRERAPRRPGPGRPTTAPVLECVWYQSPEGRASDGAHRLSVMTADVNGGDRCPARRVRA